VTDSLRIDINRPLTFHTSAGDSLPVHGVELVLTGDGKGTPPGARLVFRVAYAVFEKIIAGSLFGLTPDVRGEPASPFERDRELELEAVLRPDLTASVIAQGGGAGDLINSLTGQAAESIAFVATTESWKAISVVQELDSSGVKSGYRVHS
jgi:hypothetical protein